MVLATPPVKTEKLLTLADYFELELESDRRYEVERGVVREMPTERDINLRIASFLMIYFAQLGISSQRLRIGTEIVVESDRATVREPDLVVLSEALVTVMDKDKRSTVMLGMPAPDLVVEVVSPGKDNGDRDYRYKRSEYAVRRIGEYWIIDPEQQMVSVLEWVDGFYEVAEFSGEGAIASKTFPNLELTAQQVLQGGVDMPHAVAQSES